MDSAEEFKTWLPDYVKFRERVRAAVAKLVPDEHAQLMNENQALPMLLAKAHEMRAYASGQERRAKEARGKTHVQLWAREMATGDCDAIKERLNAVARALKVLDTESKIL